MVCVPLRFGATWTAVVSKASETADQPLIEDIVKGETVPHGSDTTPGVQVNAGDSLYIPAGGLQIWNNKDGTLGFGVTVAVDPWLPDLSGDRGTPLDVMESILGGGFPVSTICNRGTIYACQKSQEVRALIVHPEIQRLSHMVVVDNLRAVGVLDLNLARGKFRHKESESALFVEDVYEPTSELNSMRGDTPLMDYLLAADQHPFRLIELDGGKLGTVDVEDLQKLPVRVVFLMWFSYLESLLTRRLCESKPELREIVGTGSAIEAESLGSVGPGPERRIERYKFAELLTEAIECNIVSLHKDEVVFLNRYRNRIFHGPRWYVTRRREVSPFVMCAKKVVSLARELASQ